MHPESSHLPQQRPWWWLSTGLQHHSCFPDVLFNHQSFSFRPFPTSMLWVWGVDPSKSLASWLPEQFSQWEAVVGDKRWEQGKSQGASTPLLLPGPAAPPMVPATIRDAHQSSSFCVQGPVAPWPSLLCLEPTCRSNLLVLFSCRWLPCVLLNFSVL